MARKVDLTGQVFNRLTVLSFSHMANTHKHYVCKCVCGNLKTVDGNNLKNRITKSCGCLVKERLTTHGMTDTPTYSSWCNMKKRCNNPNFKYYYNYGGRGIKVCKRWNKFENFLEDMGEKPKGRSLDKIDDNKDYSKENCRWATSVEQNNNKRNNINR